MLPVAPVTSTTSRRDRDCLQWHNASNPSCDFLAIDRINSHYIEWQSQRPFFIREEDNPNALSLGHRRIGTSLREERRGGRRRAIDSAKRSVDATTIEPSGYKQKEWVCPPVSTEMRLFACVRLLCTHVCT